MTSDPYKSLRETRVVGPDELCQCEMQAPIILQPHLTLNPLVCAICNREVSPDRIGFSASLSNEISSWQKYHDAFYTLWLDSGAFEELAEQELATPDGSVVTRGRCIVSELSQITESYYWWFEESLQVCPICGAELEGIESNHSFFVCRSCHVLSARPFGNEPVDPI